MTEGARRTVAAALPYAVWMALLSVLPATAGAYAVRTAVTAAALVAAYALWPRESRPSAGRGFLTALGWGTLVGVLVCVAWIAPERSDAYLKWCVIGGETSAGPSPYDPAVCGRALTAVRLVGSAFVIAPVEEIFFRSFLYRWLISRTWWKVPRGAFDLSAFCWMVALFALEHNRIVAGAMAGAVYGLLCLRKGLGAAIVAHVVTNLLLALWVIRTGAWGFW